MLDNILDPECLVRSFTLEENGGIPNSRLPILHYKRALQLSGRGGAGEVEKIYHRNGWGGTWRNGIYAYHHYHSTAHEVLTVYCGSARVIVGGDGGVTLEIKQGDVLILPAGVGHCNASSSDELGIVGGYPPGQTWDMCYGHPGERPRADERISRVPLPKTDPIFGPQGPLTTYWLGNLSQLQKA